MTKQSAYQQLSDHFQHLSKLSHLNSICGWDQATMMPNGGNQARADALAELAVLMHEKSTRPEMQDWLSAAKLEDLTPLQQASLREMERSWYNDTALPADLVKAKSLATAHCEHAWRDQRGANDWKSFQVNLQAVMQLAIEEAQIRADKTGLKPYDAMLDLYEPGMQMHRLDKVFGELQAWLPQLIQKVVDKQASWPTLQLNGPFPTEQQKQLGMAIMEKLQFDFNHGRLDVSAHPFCGGVPSDVRITTRYEEEDFTRSLMGIVHETGHARYEQNLPLDYINLPLGQARSMGIHESQSLFFEMQLGRSQAFVEQLLPLVNTHLCQKQPMQLDELKQHYLTVKPGYIRVDADELTYPAHIMLRYELERDLINRDICVADIPELWDQKMQQYLGLSTKGNYQHGCMQDVHWPAGLIGYFPSYSLGAMYAAQFHAALVKSHPETPAAVAAGDYSQVFSWLRQNVWSQASIHDTDELVRRATGETLNTRYFEQHLHTRYL
ncbi:carboxypeptidase M32 [Agarivorans sp. MS3-6]|uniref:carboxypeptidase M32 n=1 Tax=Agarivorans sp. TSD2052 TaxID=2937286 RepID=UPI00200F9C80|nr:carboxypeptidase M32 [Agarivorans sp. TSD2052]UPW17347.1 carboxypeptidase M32 [Agarivorans sp. TSD2052]